MHKGTFNTIGGGTTSLGGSHQIWARVEDVYVAGGYIDTTGMTAGTVIPAGTMVHYAGPGKEVTLYAGLKEYDTTSTYAKDDVVLKSGKIYAAKAAIETAEAWTAAHWNEITSEVNGLIWNDVCIPDDCVLATCAVVRKGRIYADRAELPVGIEANLPMIEFVREVFA